MQEQLPSVAFGDDGHSVPVTVAICAYTADRWDKTCGAVRSVLSQRPRPEQLLLVIDHNPDLAQRARNEFPEATVLESEGRPGLSGARNSALKAAKQPITVFLDDDAEARPAWLTSLIEPYRTPDVVATGGSVVPRWPKSRPAWFPPEFDWVVGCSYLGLPEAGGAVRNPIGANMSMRTELALQVGGFDADVGRVANRPAGCEETELSIRMTASRPGSIVFYAPEAAVDHHVGTERLRIGYFIRRCWHEGLSKATVVQRVGASAGLERERRQAALIIPKSVIREMHRLASGHPSAVLRIGLTLTGLAVTAGGYITGRVRN